MYNLSSQYKTQYGCWPNEDEEKILRISKEHWMSKMTVSRFIAACLPKLSKVLWNHKVKDMERILNALKRSKIDTQATSQEMESTRKQRTLFDKSAKDYAVSRMMFAIYKDQIANSNQTTASAGIRRLRAR
jgi:hypothetical protein